MLNWVKWTFSGVKDDCQEKYKINIMKIFGRNQHINFNKH